MNKIIEQALQKRLNKYGKEIVNKWLEEEYGSIYMAKKELDDNEAICDFISDMLEQNNMTIDEICGRTKNVDNKKYKKEYKYCPYCGELLRGD